MALDRYFIPPSSEELLEMPIDVRTRYLHQILEYDEAYGTHLYRDYKATRDRCPHVDAEGERCKDVKWEGLQHCLPHASLDELDPKGTAERKSRAAKLRMSDLLNKAVDQLEALLDNDELAPQVRLQVLTQIFDRVGPAKQASQTIDGRVDVVHSTSAADIVRDRITRLSEAHLTQELQGIEQASSDDVVEGEVVEDGEAESDVA